MAGASDNNTPVEDVVIARIVRARGIRGEVACNIETDFPERFESLERVTVWMPDNRRLSLVVEDAWFHKDRVILKFEGYDTMTDATKLIGGRLVISESDAGELEEDQFYEYQIVGMDVTLANGEGLGQVKRLIRTTGTDVLVVEGQDSREYLIPFADEICTEVDLKSNRITVNPPEGLLDL